MVIASSATTILRRPQVEAETGLSRSTLYLRISQGLFIKPVSLGARAVGFPAGEVAAMNAARIAGRSESEVRALVDKLHAARGGHLEDRATIRFVPAAGGSNPRVGPA